MKKIFIVVCSIIAVLGFATVAYANPSYFGPTVQTNIATSSPTTLAVNATTTLTFDSFNPTTKTPNFAADKATLLMQLTGSTTASVMTVAVEYSQDNVDWYSDTFLTSRNASTSVSLNTTNTFTWTYATTSQTLGGSAQGTISRRVVSVPTPLRYVRAVFTASGATSTIWAQFVPVKEIL